MCEVARTSSRKFSPILPPLNNLSISISYLAAKRFLETNQLLSIVRAHQVQSDGYGVIAVDDLSHTLTRRYLSYRAYRKLGVSGLPSVITLSSCQHHRHSRASVLQYKNKGLSIRRFNPKADPYQLPDFMDAFAWSLPFVGNQCTVLFPTPHPKTDC